MSKFLEFWEKTKTAFNSIVVAGITIFAPEQYKQTGLLVWSGLAVIIDAIIQAMDKDKK